MKIFISTCLLPISKFRKHIHICVFYADVYLIDIATIVALILIVCFMHLHINYHSLDTTLYVWWSHGPFSKTDKFIGERSIMYSLTKGCTEKYRLQRVALKSTG